MLRKSIERMGVDAMEVVFLLALLAGAESVDADRPGDIEADPEKEAKVVYISPATPAGKAEFDTSRRFYFDARKKMTAADFDAWLQSIGARVVGEEQPAAEVAVAEVGVQDQAPTSPGSAMTVSAESSPPPAREAAPVLSTAPVSTPATQSKPLRVAR